MAMQVGGSFIATTEKVSSSVGCRPSRVDDERVTAFPSSLAFPSFVPIFACCSTTRPPSMLLSLSSLLPYTYYT